MRLAQIVALGAALLAVSACQQVGSLFGGQPQGPPYRSVGYQEPERIPVTDRSNVSGRASEVAERLASRLQAAGFEVSTADVGNDLYITGLYRGDGGAFIDCGTLTLIPAGGGQPRLVPASTRSLTYLLVRGRDSRYIDRQLRLDIRLVVRARPNGRRTRLSTEGQYLVTVQQAVADRGGSIEANSSEIFELGERGGQSSAGLTCYATGTAELLALEQ